METPHLDKTIEQLKGLAERVPVKEVAEKLQEYKAIKEALSIHSVMPRESGFKKALELLRDLAEIQNGSPMHKDAEEWQDIMTNIWDSLTTHGASW